MCIRCACTITIRSPLAFLRKVGGYGWTVEKGTRLCSLFGARRTYYIMFYSTGRGHGGRGGFRRPNAFETQREGGSGLSSLKLDEFSQVFCLHLRAAPQLKKKKADSFQCLEKMLRWYSLTIRNQISYFGVSHSWYETTDVFLMSLEWPKRQAKRYTSLIWSR